MERDPKQWDEMSATEKRAHAEKLRREMRNSQPDADDDSGAILDEASARASQSGKTFHVRFDFAPLVEWLQSLPVKPVRLEVRLPSQDDPLPGAQVENPKDAQSGTKE